MLTLPCCDTLLPSVAFPQGTFAGFAHTPPPANPCVPGGGGSFNVRSLGILMGPSSLRMSIAFWFVEEKFRKVRRKKECPCGKAKNRACLVKLPVLATKAELWLETTLAFREL